MGYLFGRQALSVFLSRNNLLQMVRSHQLCAEGYSITMEGRMITIWSAPNYCYRFDNKASVGLIEPERPLRIVGFEAAPESLQFKNQQKPQPFDIDKFLS